MDEGSCLFARAYGDPTDVGRQIGAQLRQPIRDLLALLDLPDCFACDAHRERLSCMLGNLDRLAPHLIAEMEGVAEGAGLPCQTIFMLNCLVELTVLGCSVLGFADAAGGPLIAKTNDLAADQTPQYAVTVLDVPGRAQFLHLTWPGTVWGGPGVNEHGVGFGGASVSTGEWNGAGLPSNMVTRLVLEGAHDVDEALEILLETEFACHPFNLVLGDEDRLIGVERSVYKMATREPEHGAVWATNHFLTPDLSDLVACSPADLEESRARWDKLGRLAGESEHTVEGARGILRDHSDPAPICRHGEGEASITTSASVIVRPRARVVWVATGSPCEEELRPFQLQLSVRSEGGHVGLGA